MTDASHDRTTGEADQAEPANSNFAVLAAIAELGMNATPAAIAKNVGIAYSTVNPKLRAWETAGLAERFRHDTGQTLWRLTDAGRASTATPAQFTDAAAPSETAPADNTTGEAAEPAMPAHSATPAAAAPQPDADNSRESTDGGDADGATTPVAAPAPADSDAATSEPVEPERDEPAGSGTAAAPAPADADNADASADPPASGTAPQPATADPSRQADGHGAPTPQPAATASAAPADGDRIRRPAGALHRTAMNVVQANPDTGFTVTELARLIDKADDDSGHHYKTASPGAVVLACERLVDRGHMTKVNERPATFKFAKALPANP